MTDLAHQTAMVEFALSSATSDMLAKSAEPWFVRRLNEEEVISAIEQLNVVLVRKRAQKQMEKAA